MTSLATHAVGASVHQTTDVTETNEVWNTKGIVLPINSVRSISCLNLFSIRPHPEGLVINVTLRQKASTKSFPHPSPLSRSPNTFQSCMETPRQTVKAAVVLSQRNYWEINQSEFTPHARCSATATHTPARIPAGCVWQLVQHRAGLHRWDIQLPGRG